MTLLVYQCILTTLLMLSCEHMVVEATFDIVLTHARLESLTGQTKVTIYYSGSKPKDEAFCYNSFNRISCEVSTTYDQSNSQGSISVNTSLSFRQLWELRIGNFHEHYYEIGIRNDATYETLDLNILPIIVNPGNDLAYSNGDSHVEATLAWQETETVWFDEGYDSGEWPFEYKHVNWFKHSDTNLQTTSSQLHVPSSMTLKFDTNEIKGGIFVTRATRFDYPVNKFISHVRENVVFNVHANGTEGPFDTFVRILEDEYSKTEPAELTCQGLWECKRITCQAQGKNVNSLKMQRQANGWTNVPTISMGSADYITEISIKRPTVAESGKYRCIVNNDESITSSEIQVTVTAAG